MRRKRAFGGNWKAGGALHWRARNPTEGTADLAGERSVALE